MKYTLNHHSKNRRLTLNALTDDAAIAEVRDFVGQSDSNETVVGVELSDGSYYQAWKDEDGIVSGWRH